MCLLSEKRRNRKKNAWQNYVWKTTQEFGGLVCFTYTGMRFYFCSRLRFGYRTESVGYSYLDDLDLLSRMFLSGWFRLWGHFDGLGEWELNPQLARALSGKTAKALPLSYPRVLRAQRIRVLLEVRIVDVILQWELLARAKVMRGGSSLGIHVTRMRSEIGSCLGRVRTHYLCRAAYHFVP